MADDEPCGSNTDQIFLQNYENVTDFTQQTLRAVLQATKCSNEMPAEGDDFDYYSSYQGFQDVMNIEGKRILHIIQGILKHQNVKVNLGTAGGAADIEDKLDLLMDANDQILERAGSWLDEASGLKKTDSTLIIASATPKLVSTASWNKKTPVGASPSAPSYRLLSARNIKRPQLKFKVKVDNRRQPFIPIIKVKPNAMKSLEDSMRLPDGVTPDMTEASDFMYPHPYQYELDQLDYTENQLAPCTAQEPMVLGTTPITMIKTVEELRDMIDLIKHHSKEIAVDLEHHSYRTFQGITCLIQISTRTQDFIVDALDLHSELHLLNEIFTDPNITKVFHGADNDIEWLQRDFGVYVVNMFDTGQAARVMNFSRFSLAHLLQHYCNVTADKQYQMADWRIRPVPEELLKYAREDTHYLLYIYDKVKNELLERGNENKNLLLSVLERSKQVTAKTYQKPLFNEDNHYELYKKSKKVFNSQQMMALRDLYAWRDEIARLEDESWAYILPNHMLLQICGILPREKQGILACCNPIPPLVRQYLNEIHAVIVKARESPLHKLEPMREQQPSQVQHPKYDVDSLLNCQHDLSHAGDHVQYKNNQTALLDPSLISKKSSLFPLKPANSSVIIIKAAPILTVFSLPGKGILQTEAQRKAAEIKARFVSPYLKYLPMNAQERVKVPNEQVEDTWKLVPSSVKRKLSSDMDTKTTAGPPPSKRSRTQLTTESDRLPQVSPASSSEMAHRTLSGTEGVEDTTEDVPQLTEDDKKALPRDIEIPLRFQVPAKKKKKKKDKNRDINIIQTVQDSVQQELERLKNSTLALGQNSGDQQPKVTDKQNVKKKKKFKKDKSDRKSDKKMKTEVVVTVDNGKDNNNSASGSKTEEFKPYDYSNAAQKLTEGGTSKQKDYFDPVSQMKKSKGPKVSKSKINRNKNKKSLTWKT